MGAFPGETEDDDLEALRELFTRKALIARQARVCEGMLADGWSREGVVSATVAQLPSDSAEAVRALELREQLGFPAAQDAPAFVMPNGEPVAPDQLTRWLRVARLVRTGLEANGGICRSLLDFRHNLGLRDTGGREMKAARLHAYHDALKLDSIDEPKADGPFDVIVRIGAAGLCRTDLHIQEGQWAEKSGVDAALHPRPRERRLGARDRLGRDQRRGGRHRHRPSRSSPAGCACPAASATTCTASTARSRASASTAASPTSSRPSPARWSSSTGLEPKDIAALADAGLTAIHAVKKAIPVLRRGHARGRHRRRRARAHRDPVPEGDNPGRDHRHRPVREGAGARRRGGSRPDREGRRHSTSTPSRR